MSSTVTSGTIRATVPRPGGGDALAGAKAALARGDPSRAEALLAALLAARPADTEGVRLLTGLLGGQQRHDDAAAVLTRALAAAPGFDAARFNLAVLLHRQARHHAALEVLAPLTDRHPGHPGYRSLKAALLARLDDPAALTLYEELLAEDPDQPRLWMSYGHALKTRGRGDDGEAAYRAAVARAPSLGEAWWSLANLKTRRFSDVDVAAMTAALAQPGLADDDRLHLDFALGKALEDRGDYAASFRHYDAGNRRRRRQLNWDGAANRAHVEACEQLFTADFFAARAGQGCAAADPIFVVGLPRSGSTLIEQILASHSQIEGTRELTELPQLARGLADRAAAAGHGRDPIAYLAMLAAARPDELHRLGETYLAATRQWRQSDRPRFVDKLPNNFALTGLIQLALPNAVIIDARRDAMATCFSAWKQHFARGQAFTYDLGELGHYYRDYVRLMAYFDRVLPGRVLRVSHEALVTDTEAEVRRLLAHCGLAFEPGCLAFHETRRSVRSASAEQVRQPITATGLSQWRHYEPWLAGLKDTLGPELAKVAVL